MKTLVEYRESQRRQHERRNADRLRREFWQRKQEEELAPVTRALLAIAREELN